MIKQVIVVRTKYPDGKGGTFGLRTGKIAAQVAHASMKVFFDRKVRGNAEMWGAIPDSILGISMTPEMAEWVNGTFTKIVLGVESEADLLKLYEWAKAVDLPTALITDLGFTEFGGKPTNTAVAIGPADSEAIDALTRSGTVITKLM